MSCTPEELILSQAPNSTIHCLTRGESIGLTTTAETGLLSLLSVIIIFILIIRNALRCKRVGEENRPVIHQPMDIYMLSLFVANLGQATGAVMDMKWIIEGKSYAGSYCTAQGVIQQIGETAVATTTLAIALYTFIVVWWRVGTHSLGWATLFVKGTWLFVGMFVGISVGIHGNDPDDIKMPTPYGCWTGNAYLLDTIFGKYIWLWAILIFSSLIYIPLHCYSRGVLVPSDTSWFKFCIHRGVNPPEGCRVRSLSAIAYPLVYAILITPLTITRWITFQDPGTELPSATFIGVSIFGLSGAANVLLFLLTRNSVLGFKEGGTTLVPNGPRSSLSFVFASFMGERPGQDIESILPHTPWTTMEETPRNSSFSGPTEVPAEEMESARPNSMTVSRLRESWRADVGVWSDEEASKSYLHLA